jgi:protein-disulfide isomerase
MKLFNSKKSLVTFIGIGLLLLVFLIYFILSVKEHLDTITSASRVKDYAYFQKNNTDSQKFLNHAQVRGGISVGNPDAEIVFVEFYDFNCPYCQEYFSTIRRLIEKYEDQVLFVFKDMPLLGEDSEILAKGAYCAQREGKFIEYHDRVFLSKIAGTYTRVEQIATQIGITPLNFVNCLNSDIISKQVEDSVLFGWDNGVQGTPTTFINGRMLPGTISFEELDELFQGILNFDLTNL